jgi:hypothetical protein
MHLKKLWNVPDNEQIRQQLLSLVTECRHGIAHQRAQEPTINHETHTDEQTDTNRLLHVTETSIFYRYNAVIVFLLPFLGPVAFAKLELTCHNFELTPL